MTHIYYIKKWGSMIIPGIVSAPLYFKKPCRILCRGRNGNLLLEFEDGYLMTTVRHGVRRIAALDAKKKG